MKVDVVATLDGPGWSYNPSSPPSCEEEENLKLLAETDLGEDSHVSEMERIINHAASHMYANSGPIEIFVSPKTFKELHNYIFKRDPYDSTTIVLSNEVHTSSVTVHAVE